MGMAGLSRGKLQTILVVDDTDLVLRVVAAILERAKFTVLQAATGPLAMGLASAFTGTIDLLLCDLKLLEIPGLELGHLLKEQRPEMRVMMMSGFPGRDLVLPHQGWSFIQKPFVAEKLVRTVKAFLRAPNLQKSRRPRNARKRSS